MLEFVPFGEAGRAMGSKAAEPSSLTASLLDMWKFITYSSGGARLEILKYPQLRDRREELSSSCEAFQEQTLGPKAP